MSSFKKKLSEMLSGQQSSKKQKEYEKTKNRIESQKSMYDNELQGGERSQNAAPKTKSKSNEQPFGRKPVAHVDKTSSQRPGTAKTNGGDQSPRKNQHNHQKRSSWKPEESSWIQGNDSGSPNRAGSLAQIIPSESGSHSSVLPRAAATGEISGQRQRPKSQGREALRSGEGIGTPNRAGSLSQIVPSESDSHSSPLPRVADTGEISGQRQRPKSRGREALRSAEDYGDSNAVVDIIYYHLRKARNEFPSDYLEKDIPNPRSLADIEVAVSNLIQAYGSVYRISQKSHKSYKNLVADYEYSQNTFKNEEAKWIRKLKQCEAHIQALGNEIGKEKLKISVLREEHANREHRHDSKMANMQNENHAMKVRIQQQENEAEQSKQGYENQVKALEMRHQAELAAREMVAQEDINRIKRDYDTQLEKIREQYETRLASMREQNKDIERRMISEHHKQLGNAREEHLQEVDKMAVEMKMIRTQYEADKKKMEELHGAKILALEIKCGQEKKSLKDDIAALTSALVRREHFKAMSDYDLANRFQNLASEVDEFARVRWDIKREPTWPFSDKVIRKSQNERRTKQHIVQNTLWVIFYERIFCTPFRVLGGEGKSLERTWIEMYRQDHKNTGALAVSPWPTKDSEKWRCETMRKCLEAIRSPGLELEPNSKLYQSYESSLREVMEDVSQELERVAAVSSSDKQRMSEFVRKAAQLWLEVGHQPYRIFLVMSKMGEEPSRSGSASLNSDGTQDLVTRPEVRRIGNSQGERLERDEVVADCKGLFSVFHS